MKRRLWWGAVLCVMLSGIVAAQTVTKTRNGAFMSAEEEGRVSMAAGQLLRINAASTLGGKIVLQAGGSECRYRYQKVLKASTKTEAVEFAALITIEVEKLKEGVVMSLRAPASAPWTGTAGSGRLEIHIAIPDSCLLEINTAYFDIEAVGPFAGFTVSESLSQVSVDNVRGPVDVKVSNRPIIIKNVTGPLLATNKYSRIRLENIDTGDGMGTIRNEHGEVTIDVYRGGIDVRTSYDRIIGQHLAVTGTKNRFRNVSAVINLALDSLTAGALRVNNMYDQILLEIGNRVDAAFICKTEGESTITAEHMDMEPTLVYENRLEFTTGTAAAEVRLTAKGSGDIIITGPDRDDIAGGR